MYVMISSLHRQCNTGGATLSISLPYMPPLRRLYSFLFLCQFIYVNTGKTFAERAEIIQTLSEISKIALLPRLSEA